MAGHSQFKNIMHRKGAQDAKRAKVFTKIGREIETAVRTGSPDPAANPRLRAAILAARAANMPRERVDRAINKGAGTGDDATIYEEVRYEGYGPGGIALIVEGLTDNRNRTAADVRSAFTKHGGTLGESNSVSFMFDRVGNIQYPAAAASSDDMFEAALDAGADDVVSTDDGHEITTSLDNLGAVRDALEAKFGAAAGAKLMWKPQNLIPLAREPAETLFKLLDVLDEHDDIQTVYANFDVAEDVMAEMAG
jgi:YebC/PmpR family DNA-binding regulatory protein